MGMSISAKLIYGLTYEEFDDSDKIDELYEEDELERASPCYDSHKSEWVLGIRVGMYEFENTDLLLSRAKEAQEEFEKLTGQKGRFFVTQHVY